MNRKKYVIVIAVCALICICALGISKLNSKPFEDTDSGQTPEFNEKDYNITVVEPNCVENGYTLYEKKDGTHSYTSDFVEPLGHQFVENTISSRPEIGFRTYEKVCQVCGEREEGKELTPQEIPTLWLYGDMENITREEPRLFEGEYISAEESMHVYVSLIAQGHYTRQYPKINYTLKFFTDDTYLEKNKIKLNGWHKENKYILKANYLDTTQCRNISCSNIWSEMVASRDNLHPRLKETTTYGAVDGFPVCVCVNDEFFGLYMMCLHKDDDLYDMEKENDDAVFILNHDDTDQSQFKKEIVITGSDDDDWEVEFCGTKDQSWAIDSFNEMVRFMNNSTDKEFTEKIGNYLDVDAAIDYFIAVNTLGLIDNLSDDLVMLNYDDGIWIPSVYDCEEAFGYDSKKETLYEANKFLPDKDCSNLLWKRLQHNFNNEIVKRYSELRQSILSESNIFEKIDNIKNSIPERYFEQDENRFSDRLITDTDQIKDYIHERLSVLDTLWS